jgi:hypothetical protein
MQLAILANELAMNQSMLTTFVSECLAIVIVEGRLSFISIASDQQLIPFWPLSGNHRIRLDI